ncbi:MAG TPA: formate dehydrogenase accessory sulfurtransferase FdhD [Xanthobacteraceae bacterium]|nr:formate dehydrogenase accessory sulfurtransferase FdhD [Xanthobacteraceae bacterium]
MMTPLLPPASIGVPRVTREGQLDRREVAEECPVALVYDGTTAAVVMATPSNLSDLAIGFSLTEGIVRSAAEIQNLEIIPSHAGIEARMWLTADVGRNFQSRHRRLIGPTGCGLCGIESLGEANRQLPNLTRAISLAPSQIGQAVEALANAQTLNRTTRATHAAGFYLPENGLVLAREDVGRHNALDKLAGALAAERISGGTGAVVLTSRVSVEMVQKTAMVGSCILVAISAPTALAVRTAETCGITLIGIARGSAFEIFSHPDAIGREKNAGSQSGLE